MSIKTKHILIMLAALFVLLTGCSGKTESQSPTPNPEAVLTAAAYTAEARLTELAQPTATTTPSPLPSSTPLTPTPPEITPTQIVGFTPTFATGVPSTGVDRAEFLADVTVPDGTDFKPGEKFAKVWRLTNAGTSTWTTAYTFAFVGGAQMGGLSAVPLPQTVAPGANVDISVDFVAPQESGRFRGFWEMRNAAGQFFETAVYVEIDVVGGTPAGPGTQPPPGSARVSDMSLSVDDAAPDECPHLFTFTGTFELSAPATVTYQLEAGSDTAGFTFDLPGPITTGFEAGKHTVTYTLDISDSVNGWARLVITAPQEAKSNQVNFSLTCSP